MSNENRKFKSQMNVESPHDDGEAIWLMSYADLVTLLLGSMASQYHLLVDPFQAFPIIFETVNSSFLWLCGIINRVYL